MPSFIRHKSNNSKIIIPSLITFKKTINVSKKRVFFLSSIRLKGSMALEGSMVLPIFLFFMMTVLLCLEAVRIQSNMQEALHQAGNESAFMQTRMENHRVSEEEVTERILTYIEKQKFPYLCVAGEKEGVVVQDFSTVNNNGLIYLKSHYQLKPFIRWIPIGDIIFEDEYYSHAWVGFQGNEDIGQTAKEDVCVYITKTGSRYHMSYECTYLQVPIRAVSGEQIGGIRNASGGKYYPCERCRPQNGDILFISEDGSRYHGRSDCAALKRTVYIISLSKAQGYAPCSKCGGGT